MATRTFTFTQNWQQWRVPERITHVAVTLNGAGSSNSRGGRVSGILKVDPEQTLFIMVGGEGRRETGFTGGYIGGDSTFGGGAHGGSGVDHGGGDGGGGACAIRLGSETGVIKAAAGGAGGRSTGDGGRGGQGGAGIAERGWTGSAGDGSVVNAKGGTQTEGGPGAIVAFSPRYNGGNADTVALGRGGSGGQVLKNGTYGGGGGGGGYRAGGGGACGFSGVTPASGGGGGSNFIGDLIEPSSLRGGGAEEDGSVVLTWVGEDPDSSTPAPVPDLTELPVTAESNFPPNPPSNVLIDDDPAVTDHITGSTDAVTISAEVDDPNTGQPTRLLIQFSPDNEFLTGVQQAQSPLVLVPARLNITLRGLSQNVHYFVRLHSQDSLGLVSESHNTVDFWTNRDPLEPIPLNPVENATVPQGSQVAFRWRHADPDGGLQNGSEVHWRRAAGPFESAGGWTSIRSSTPVNALLQSHEYLVPANTFKGNLTYEWKVRTQDPQGSWGPFSPTQSFYVTGASTPPILRFPLPGEAKNVALPVTFTWLFRDPNQGDSQALADLRYRAVGTADWFTNNGTTTTPGASDSWMFPARTFFGGVNYEWQVRTKDAVNALYSDWSDSGFFWGVRLGTSVVEEAFPQFESIQGALGCGNNRVFVYDRGGKILRGEITPVTRVQWARKRDDISSALIDTSGFGDDCGQLLKELRSWVHEIVIFRDGVRVWDGPITRITYGQTSVEIEAKDVMAYLYRRIMRQGYNDSYQKVNGQQLGLKTVVERAMLISLNALAPDDPNLIQYLTSLQFSDDARQSRVVPDYSRTAWEEIDDLAATAGLDYTALGRRIVYWDTHRPLGRLPEMRDENFSDPPIVTEYGMQTATYFAVTNNNGVWGAAEYDHEAYGLVEQLASAYGETEGAVEEALTAAAREALTATLTSQAIRNIGGRWPTPLIVRVPDNSTLHPESNLGINQLIPGVWVPLRSRGTVRDVTQWQKLDSVAVEQTDSGEKIGVSLSPAPNGGGDPDSDAAAVEAS